MVVCPNCGYKQAGGEKCEKCSTLFAYYDDDPQERFAGFSTAASRTPHTVAASNAPLAAGSSRAPLNAASSPMPPAAAFSGAAPDAPGTHAAVTNALPAFLARAGKYYRPARWIVLGLMILVVILIFRKGTPPPVAVDPNAAARAAEKIRASDAQSSAGQPHQLQLDRTELNSYLNENLAINGRTEPGTAAIAPPDTSLAGAAANATPSGNAAANSINASNSPGSPNAANSSAPNSPAPTLEEVQSSVKDVKVDMVGDLVKAYVVFNFHGQDLSLELDGHLRAENGYLKFDPVSGSLGSLPLPSSALQSAAQRMFESPENREKMKLPAGVSDIQIVDGNVVVNYDK